MNRLGNQNPRRVLAAADALEAELAALPKIEGMTFEERFASRRRYQAALDALESRLYASPDFQPTTCAQAWNGARFAALGLRASSTTDLAGAIRNWITQARRKAGAQAAPGEAPCR